METNLKNVGIMKTLAKAKFLEEKPCMAQDELKIRFDSGFHTEALIVSAPMVQKGFNVAIKGRGYWVWVASARKPKEPREFKSLDAAMSAVAAIGFKSATIELA